MHPCGAVDVPLPDRLAAVVGLHMVGHIPPPDRRRLWTAVAARLARGGSVVLNVQPPDSAVAVPLFPWSGTTIGAHTYEGRGEAEVIDQDCLHWRMAYRTRVGDTVLAETTADYRWWVLSAAGLADELSAAGLEVRVDDDLVVGRRPQR